VFRKIYSNAEKRESGNRQKKNNGCKNDIYDFECVLHVWMITHDYKTYVENLASVLHVYVYRCCDIYRCCVYVYICDMDDYT